MPTERWVTDLLVSWAPMIVLIAVWLFVMRRWGNRPSMWRDHFQRYEEHMGRVEAQLDRIAAALELVAKR